MLSSAYFLPKDKTTEKEIGTMAKAQDRKEIVARIGDAAKLYRDRLVGKRFMYVFDGRYIEVIYKAENFRHLTGVEKSGHPVCRCSTSYCFPSSFLHFHKKDSGISRYWY